MVHPVSMGVCDYLTAEDLNNCLKALETIRSSIVDCSGLYDGFKDLNEYLTKTKENK